MLIIFFLSAVIVVCYTIFKHKYQDPGTPTRKFKYSLQRKNMNIEGDNLHDCNKSAFDALTDESLDESAEPLGSSSSNVLSPPSQRTLFEFNKHIATESDIRSDQRTKAALKNSEMQNYRSTVIPQTIVISDEGDSDDEDGVFQPSSLAKKINPSVKATFTSKSSDRSSGSTNNGTNPVQKQTPKKKTIFLEDSDSETDSIPLSDGINSAQSKNILKKKTIFSEETGGIDDDSGFRASTSKSIDPQSSNSCPENEKKRKGMFNWKTKAGKNVWTKKAKDSIDSDTHAPKWNPKRFLGGADKSQLRAMGEGSYDDFSQDCNSAADNTLDDDVKQKSIVISGVNVKFPVDPYSCQIAVMNKVIQGCTKEENCLLESPTGSGKTLALLCSVLAWHDHFVENMRVENEKMKIYGSDKDCEGMTPDMMGKKEYSKEWTYYKASLDSSTLDNYNESLLEKYEDETESLFNNGLPAPPKIYYGSRTHKQIEQVIRELKKTAYKFKKMTILSSREQSCIQETEKNKTELCHELLDPQKKRGCKYRNERNKRDIGTFSGLMENGIEGPWDIEDLVSVGQNIGSCPYFAARSLMTDAEIIFCPYNYIIDPLIRESMQISLKDAVVILDEAHNIEDICRSVAGADFREDYIYLAIVDCANLQKTTRRNSDTYNCLYNYLTTFKKFISTVKLKSPEKGNYYSEKLVSDYWKGDDFKKIMSMYDLKENFTQRFLECGEIAIAAYRKSKEDARGTGIVEQHPEPVISAPTMKLLESLILALDISSSKAYAKDYQICITEDAVNDSRMPQENEGWRSRYQKTTQRVRCLQFMCMNPAVIFSQIAKVTRSVILASGTLTPMDSFQSELGTTFKHVLTANHVIPREQVLVKFISQGPTGITLKATFAEAKSWDFQDELGRLVLNVCQSVPHGVLCFFTSYTTLNTLIERWKSNGTWAKLENVKHILQEPRYASELTAVMSEFREIIQSTSDGPRTTGITGALLLAVFRGKVAEGIDFSDNEARCVLTVGIPYPNVQDPGIKMKRDYNDKNASNGLLSGSQWYNIQAYRALNQALGRCLRHKNDWGAVLLVDQRFSSDHNVAGLPKWVKVMRDRDHSRDLPQDLRNFVDRQLIRENTKK